MHLQYQTNELVPPPYAHAIEAFFTTENKELKIKFELTYLNREALDLEEILEEGFTENDDIFWEGSFNENWLSYVKELTESLTFIPKTEIEESEDYWQIEVEERSGYPENVEPLLILLQELQQAIFEQAEFEAPLQISFLRKSHENEALTVFKGSFEQRTFEKTCNGKAENLAWSRLNPFLQEVFSGEFRQEQANQKEPKKSGLFVNLGDEFWYELGKSYLIQPSKIHQFLA